VENCGRHGWRKRKAVVFAREALSYLFFIPISYTTKVLLERVGRYDVENWREARAQYERIAASAERAGQPILFCANHLTFIDSIVLFWVFNPVWRYLINYRRIFWNVPAGDFFARIWYFKWIFRLSKCIFVYRDASPAHKAQVLAELRAILESGSSLLLFPEGRRSRSGKVEVASLTTGAARLALSVPGCRLVCVHSRSDRQATYANYPPRFSRFFVQMEEIDFSPYLAMPEREAQIGLTAAIGRSLLRMEERHFEVESDLPAQKHVESRKREQIREERRDKGDREEDRHLGKQL
jgi:hypothetical protein